VLASAAAMTALNKDSSDPSPTRRSVLWSGIDLETHLFKQGCRSGGGILVVDLCPRAPPLRRRSLQRRRGAWEVVQERMQIVVCIDSIWKMVNRVLGSWFVDGRYGFLLRRLSRAGVPDLEFDGVSDVLPRSDSFNGNDFACGEPPWRSAKLHISNGAASSSGIEMIRHLFVWWLLWWCQRKVTGVGVKHRGVFGLDCNFTFWLLFLCAKASVLLSFQFCQVGCVRGLY
jgi:hypothetical protein